MSKNIPKAFVSEQVLLLWVDSKEKVREKRNQSAEENEGKQN